MGAWLAGTTLNHADQDFDTYVQSRPNRPSKKQRTIYFLPFTEKGEEGKEGCFPDLDWIAAITSAWFDMPVKMLKPKNVLKARAVGSRPCNVDNEKQYNASDIIRAMVPLVPKDAYCLIGLTMQDLWSGGLMFVFGLASLKSRTGVFSFRRHDPCYFRTTYKMNRETFKAERVHDDIRHDGDEDLLLWRSTHTVLHEVGHMFGWHHCTFYRCTMQGYNGQEEGDADPLHLCPVCLRKLAWCVSPIQSLPCGDWLVRRYHAIHNQMATAATPFKKQLEWLEARLKTLGAPVPESAVPLDEEHSECEGHEDEAAMEEETSMEAAMEVPKIPHGGPLDADAEAVFDAIDKDGNGELSHSELEFYLSDFGLDQDDINTVILELNCGAKTVTRDDFRDRLGAMEIRPAWAMQKPRNFDSWIEPAPPPAGVSDGTRPLTQAAAAVPAGS